MIAKTLRVVTLASLKEMSTPAQPTSKSKRTRLLVAGTIAVVIVVLLIPPLIAGGFMVPVSVVNFNEATGSLTATSAQVTVQSMTAYEYYLSVRSAGRVRTSDTDVSSSRGTTNITMRMELTTPSNQTISLGNATIRGAMGTRAHTIYLSIDDGVRAAGSYRLDIIITASVAPVGGLLQINLTTTVRVNFTVS